MTNTIRNLISRSSNVIIAGHLEMDADCIGAALCMSVFAKTIGKEACIVTKSGGVEPMIADVMKKYASILESRHDFVSENEALNRLKVDSLGLDSVDIRYLKGIIERFKGGPVGLEALASAIGEETMTLEDVYEPYLMQIGFVNRTPRGRIVTQKAYEHLKISNTKSLF